MGTKHSREQILDGAVAAALDAGLSRLTFGSLARRLGIPDRTVVYYFPTKSDLVGAVLVAIGTRLQEALGGALTGPVAGPADLVRRLWPALAADEMDPLMALFFEANGLASAGREPYAALVPALVEAWIEWAALHLDGDQERRRSDAEAAIALSDGLLLLRQLAGPAAAERAAARLGIT